MSSRIQISNGIEVSVNNKAGMRRRLAACVGKCSVLFPKRLGNLMIRRDGHAKGESV